MFYAFRKNGEQVDGYLDCNGGFTSIDSAALNVGEGGYVKDEEGNVVWKWPEVK